MVRCVNKPPPSDNLDIAEGKPAQWGCLYYTQLRHITPTPKICLSVTVTSFENDIATDVIQLKMGSYQTEYVLNAVTDVLIIEGNLDTDTYGKFHVIMMETKTREYVLSQHMPRVARSHQTLHISKEVASLRASRRATVLLTSVQMSHLEN